jgi:hypothetical protein
MDPELDPVRKSLTEALELARLGIQECEDKLRQVDLIKLELSKHHNTVARLEAALRALDGKHNPPEKERKSREGTTRPYHGENSMPFISKETWLSFVTTEPQRAVEIYPMAVAHLGIEPTETQARLLMQRLKWQLAQLINDGTVQAEGYRGDRRYFRNG